MARRTRLAVLKPTRAAAIVGCIAVVLSGLVLAAAPPAEAAGSITPWSSSVAVGGTFSVTAGGCPQKAIERPDGYTIQQAQLVLVVGSGASERLAAFGEGLGGTRVRFRVPGWVDPNQAAVVAGSCVTTEIQFDEQTGGSTTSTTTFAYADAPIDITPGTAVPAGPVITVDRSTAAAGQFITVHGTGCQGADEAEVVLLEGGDLSGRSQIAFAAGSGGTVEADGSFTVQVALNGRTVVDGDLMLGPLAEGPYVLIAACAFGVESDNSVYLASEPTLVTVDGTNPTGAFDLRVVDGTVEAMGSGCPSGTTVTVSFVGSTFDGGGFEEFDRRRVKGMALRSLRDLPHLTTGPDGEIDETVTTTAGADGTWSVSSPAPDGDFDLQGIATCGDPAADGFLYVPRYTYRSSPSAELYVDRTSPTSSPTGGTVLIQVGGVCDGEAQVALVDLEGNVLDESDPIALNDYGLAAGRVTAPDQPGTYYAVGMCDGGLGYGNRYPVFTPAAVSAAAPLAEEPAEGWPSQGPRETYHGKIGPISLPAMETMGMALGGGKALGPSELFIPVPRPSGDFAITKLSFDLVDAEGMPVDASMAHLHHFVITNRSRPNPACPGGTFGLPGQIVGAAGAERTVLKTGDPYGVVVKGTDQWTGVYELMSRSAADQQVYLSYDIDYRRDVENVRPVTSYFGSATGCDTFTWTLDGSGTPDVQSHFITIAKPGRLIGAGGHLHNGASYADLTNDRGRRLCRSEITYGTEQVGMAMARGPRDSGTATATTAVGGIPFEEGPPEFYDDDLVIDRISNCPLAEQLSAGERLRFDAAYANDRPRSGVMGIFTAYVWEGGGPAQPGPGAAAPIPGSPSYAG